MQTSSLRRVQSHETDGRRQTVVALIDQTLVSGVNFATGLVLARFLGLDGYGRFVLVYGVVLFVVAMQMALISLPMMVAGPAKGREERSSYYRTVVWLQCGFSVVTAGMLTIGSMLAVVFVPAWGVKEFATALIATAVAFTGQEFFRRVFFAQGRAVLAFTNDLIRYGLQLAGIAAAGVVSVLSPAVALWIITATSAAAALHGIVYFAVEGAIGPVQQRSLLAGVSDHWDFGKWLIGRNIAYWCGNQMVFYLAGGILTVAAVGAIRAAGNIVGAANILFLALENLVPSRASRLRSQQGDRGMSHYLRRVTVLGAGMTAVIVFVASFWSGFWMQFFYGAEYQEYDWIVVWWGVYYVIGFFQRPLNAGLRAINRTKDVFYANLFGAIVVISTSIPAMYVAAIGGAMASMCVAQVVIVVILYLDFYRHLSGNNGNSAALVVN